MAATKVGIKPAPFNSVADLTDVPNPPDPPPPFIHVVGTDLANFEPQYALVPNQTLFKMAPPINFEEVPQIYSFESVGLGGTYIGVADVLPEGDILVRRQYPTYFLVTRVAPGLFTIQLALHQPEPGQVPPPVPPPGPGPALDLFWTFDGISGHNIKLEAAGNKKKEYQRWHFLRHD